VILLLFRFYHNIYPSCGFSTRIVVLFVFQSENMEALNVLRILTALHILSVNMKNANVELVSLGMEERASLVRSNNTNK